MGRFLIWCAGASPELLSRCPATDRLRQTILGTFVLLTGLIAGVGAYYAFYSTSLNHLVAIPCALLWAGLIFTLDRLVVSSLYPTKRGNVYTLPPWQAMPRMALAALIGVTVAIPIELYIFREEILRVVRAEHDSFLRKIIQNDTQARANRLLEIEGRCEAKVGRSNQKQLLLQLKDLQRQIDSTILGTDGTRPTCGRVCKDLIAQRDEAQFKQSAEAEKWTTCIASESTSLENDEDATRIREYRRKLREDADNAASSPSFLTQYTILQRLSAQHEEIWRATIFLPLLFIFFELAPVLAKVIAGVSTYELLALQERTTAIEDTDDLVHRTKIARERRVAEETRDSQIFQHELEMVRDMQHAMNAQFSEHTLSRFRTSLLAFDEPTDENKPTSELATALLQLIRQKVDRFVRLEPYMPTATLRPAGGQAAISPRAKPDGGPPEQSPVPLEAKASDHASSTIDSAQQVNPPKSTHEEHAQAATKPAAGKVPKSEEYKDSFIKKSLESIAAKTPDFISYIFSSSAAFVAGFPTVMVGLYSTTGLPLLVLFPSILAMFVLGRRYATVRQAI